MTGGRAAAAASRAIHFAGRIADRLGDNAAVAAAILMMAVMILART